MSVQTGMMVGFCLLTAACVSPPPGGVLAEADAEKISATKSENRIQPVRGDASRPITAEWIVWDWIQCDANWKQHCRMNESAEANPEWDACKPIWGKVSAGKGGPLWAVTMNDHNTVRYYMDVKGSWNPIDQWGSTLRVENVGMIVISRGATLSQRKAAGCVESFSYNSHHPKSH